MRKCTFFKCVHLSFWIAFLLQLIQQEQQNRRDAERAMREDIDRKFLTLKHATEELNLDIKEQLKVTQITEKRSLSLDVDILL